MNKFVEFLINNYVYILTFTIILIFALIGYIYDTKKNKSDLLKKVEEEIDEEAFESLNIPDGKSINDVVGTSKNIDPETKSVVLTDPSLLEEQQNITQDNK